MRPNIVPNDHLHTIVNQSPHTVLPLKENKEQQPKQTVVQFNDPPRVDVNTEKPEEDSEEDSVDEQNDSDLDDEIRTELDELTEDDSSLKKKSKDNKY